MKRLVKMDVFFHYAWELLPFWKENPFKYQRRRQTQNKQTNEVGDIAVEPVVSCLRRIYAGP